ncbi:MAG TPA: Gfo/Idh/MocA family oxidoreductase [Candidatus Limnocylindria bacterium]|nr:Gfo/Idh/MocA family oxidoreductase [Candidatus Limnocylindria bacterium]
MAKLRWGILSTAKIARTKVIPAIAAAPSCQVVAIASRDAATARSTADALGIPTAHASYEALLADPEVDAVYIPLPNHLHAEWTVAAAGAGKHVLCEKPLALTAAEAERMIAACEAAGVRLMEAFMYRHHPSWVALRELVERGRIGELVAVQSWFSFFNDDPSNIRNILDAGGGALYDIGCYCVNLSRMLFGSEPMRVKSAITRDPVSGVDTVVSAILEFEPGVASFTASTRAEDDQRVHVHGTTGRISIEIPFNIPPDRPTRIHVASGGDPPVAPDVETIAFEPADPYTVEAEAFARAVLEDRPVPLPPTDAVANLRVMAAIFSAAAAEREALA